MPVVAVDLRCPSVSQHLDWCYSTSVTSTLLSVRRCVCRFVLSVNISTFCFVPIGLSWPMIPAYLGLVFAVAICFHDNTNTTTISCQVCCCLLRGLPIHTCAWLHACRCLELSFCCC